MLEKSNYLSVPLNVYLYDTLLLVSDSLSGLLVYSVADVQAPRFKVRIPLNGNRGMAMKDSIIYANAWGGILAIRLVNDRSIITMDISNPASPKKLSETYVGWDDRNALPHPEVSLHRRHERQVEHLSIKRRTGHGCPYHG